MTFLLSNDVRKAIKKYSKDRDKSYSQFISMLVKEYNRLNKRPKKSVPITMKPREKAPVRLQSIDSLTIAQLCVLPNEDRKSLVEKNFYQKDGITYYLTDPEKRQTLSRHYKATTQC